MRSWLIIAVLALVGGVVATIVFLAGVDQAAAVAMVLGAVSLAAGFSAIVGPIGAWGVPGDDRWPSLRGGGGHA